MITQKEIKESLLAQLKAKEADIALYQSKIDEYMWLYKQFRQMQTDINKRGRTYTAVSAAGKEYEKDNPSVKNALLYSKQMVSILDALGLSTENVVSQVTDNGEDEEHDL